MFSRRTLCLASRFGFSMLVVAMFIFWAPASASTLTLMAPHDILEKVDVQASLTASDPAGLAMLFVDGTLARSVEQTSGPATLTVSAVPLSAGPHQLRLLVRAHDRLVESTPCTVVSWRKPVPPLLLTPGAGYAGRSTVVVAKAGPGTATLKLIFNGKVITTRAATPGQVVNLGTVTMGGGVNTVVIEAANPVSSTTGTFRVRRMDFPWPTCIIIDKSEYRLYWVRDGNIVKTYPIAIGKAHTPTPVRNWRVGAKYTYSEWGVYGPRRLRLFRQVGPSSFEYTAYGVHGTNQEWVIGTMASHGCIRMFNRDVLELYPQVPLYTMVQTRE